MKKLFLLTGLGCALIMSGCQQFQDTAQNLRQQSESTITNLSQQADNVKTQVIKTKEKFDEKSQQVVNAVDAVNKVMK